jgi:hypothetical protein
MGRCILMSLFVLVLVLRDAPSGLQHRIHIASGFLYCGVFRQSGSLVVAPTTPAMTSSDSPSGCCIWLGPKKKCNVEVSQLGCSKYERDFIPLCPTLLLQLLIVSKSCLLFCNLFEAPLNAHRIYLDAAIHRIYLKK